MKNLRQIQLEFAEYLNGNDKHAIASEIVSDEKADLRERMDVYHDAYHLRLIDTLATDYPALRKLLGDMSFSKASIAYIKNYPSTYKSIRWFGVHLPEFFNDTGGNIKFDKKLQEMAQFEKLKNDCFDAQDVAVISLDELAAIEPHRWEVLSFELIPACKLCEFKHNIPTVWTELQGLHEQDDAVSLDTWEESVEEVPWFIWRSEYSPHWRSLEVDEAWAIRQFIEGRTFGDVCVGLNHWLDEEHIPLRAVSLIKFLINDGLVHKLRNT